MARKAPLVETVHFRLYDLGRSVDLDEAARLLPAHSDFGFAKRRGTPASLTLPTPLVLDLGGGADCSDLGCLERLSMQAKIYEEGVATIVVRARVRLPLARLSEVAGAGIETQGRRMSVDAYAEEGFARLFEALKPAISEPIAPADMDRESYVAYCFREVDGDPERFLSRNRRVLTALLIGEDPAAELHESQIDDTLGRPFSYREGDLAVFDLDRCLIVDPRGDYEDLLLIAEHANYQLLELRSLDKLLDAWLDEAERDIRRKTGGRRLPRLRGSADVKVAHIQAMRLDALFILENLENSSKIIGDYYLGQVYSRLCDIFSTGSWKRSVERRLDILQDVYELFAVDANERKLRWLEIVIIVVCVVSPLVEILKLILAER